MKRRADAALGALVVAALGCGAPAPRIQLDEGPVALVFEGAVARIAVVVDAPPASGACAPPFSSDTFEAVIESGRELFERVELEQLGGGVELVVEPRCDAIAPGGSDTLVPINIRSRDGCAREQRITIQIRENQGAECAPGVRAWTGDCATVPDETSLSLAIPHTAAPPPVCIRFDARDPTGEDLYIRLTGTLPPELVDTSLVSIPEPIAEFDTLTIPVMDTTHIKGDFEFDAHVYFEPPMPGVLPARIETIRLRVGTPGLSLSVPPAPSAVELGATKISVRVWRLTDDPAPPDRRCLRASRATDVDPLGEVPRKKPFLRVENALTGEEVPAGEWICGGTFWVSVSPPIDAPPQELVELEVNTCMCGTIPTTTGTAISEVVAVDTTSVAEQMSCGTADAELDNMVVCADVNNDKAPDIVFRKRAAGGGGRICVFAGSADSGKDVRHAQVDLPVVQQTEIPEQMRAFLWRGPNGSRPVILGKFSDAPFMRLLKLTGGVPSWVSASDLGIASAQLNLRAGAPVGQMPNGAATYYALPSGTDVELRCISSVCSDVVLSDVVDTAHVIIHVGRADLDGDGDVDLVAFARPIVPPFYMRVYAIRLDWSNLGAPTVDGTQTLVTGGPSLRSGFINRECATPPCPQVLYAGAVGPDLINQLLQVPTTNPPGATGLVSTLSAVRDLAGYRGRLLVGMEYGVSEAVPDGDVASWILRDPVIAEDRLVGPVTTQLPGYGRSVAPCVILGKPSVAFTADTATVRWTELDVDVALP